MNAGAGIPPESGGAGRQAAILKDFSVWFCRRFARVEAAREAKNQIEVRFGQTQAGEHHIQAFNDSALSGKATMLSYVWGVQDNSEVAQHELLFELRCLKVTRCSVHCN
jgi:hypothetical protein